MKINIDRLCKLAGVSNPSSNNRTLNETRRAETDEAFPAALAGAAGRAALSYGAGKVMNRMMDEAELEDGMDHNEGDKHDEGHDDDHNEAHEDGHLDEIIEVDEAVLVQELRRAKNLMAESARRRSRRIDEHAEIKRIIREEIEDLLDFNLSNGWVYGKQKPRRSRPGVVNHGSFIKGIGFK
jgi:hypothetical protein